MYLHLGKGKIVSTEDIVGIFDLDITSQSHLTVMDFYVIFGF